MAYGSFMVSGLGLRNVPRIAYTIDYRDSAIGQQERECRSGDVERDLSWRTNLSVRSARSRQLISVEFPKEFALQLVAPLDVEFAYPGT